MTYHLIFASLVVMALAATWLEHAAHVPMTQPAYAVAQQSASNVPGRGFTAAFGQSATVRNLMF